MILNLRRAPVLLLTAGCITACSNGPDPFSAMIPAGATSVAYVHESTSSDGVAFRITSEPESYRYIQGIRGELKSSGYSLCKKSAISQWEPLPGDDRRPIPNERWMVEMYEAKNLEKFFVLRVVAVPGEDGTWIQTIHLAAQSVAPGRQDMASIREFCGSD